jgi:hypothetical protein
MRLTKRRYMQPGTRYQVHEHKLEIDGRVFTASRAITDLDLRVGLPMEEVEYELRRMLADELVELIYKAHA